MNYLFIFLLLALSAFFSASETAFFSLNTFRLEKLKKQNRDALRIELLKNHPDRLLSTILLGNMFVNILLSSLFAVVFVQLSGHRGLMYSFVITTLVILLFGEILPKTIAYYNAEKVAILFAGTLDVMVSLFLPVTQFIVKFSKFLLNLIFGKKHNTIHEDVVTEEELKVALNQSVLQGGIAEDTEEMIQSVLAFSQIDAYSVMTPRPDVCRLDVNEKSGIIIQKLVSCKHSYLPVFEDSVDNIIGVLRTKDYFFIGGALRPLLLEPYFVPESMKIDDLLRDLIIRKQKIAVVVDEHGGFSGIVTQEDIKEEIFGEIYDEYEHDQGAIIERSPGEYLIAAGISVADINWELDFNMSGEEMTLAGKILDYLKRFPAKGETFTLDGFDMKIENCTKRKILKVSLAASDKDKPNG